MRPGEIYLARFPFGDVPGMKLRPVLLLTETVGLIPEVLVAYISSVVPTHYFDLNIFGLAEPRQFSELWWRIRFQAFLGEPGASAAHAWRGV